MRDGDGAESTGVDVARESEIVRDGPAAGAELQPVVREILV